MEGAALTDRAGSDDPVRVDVDESRRITPPDGIDNDLAELLPGGTCWRWIRRQLEAGARPADLPAVLVAVAAAERLAAHRAGLTGMSAPRRNRCASMRSASGARIVPDLALRAATVSRVYGSAAGARKARMPLFFLLGPRSAIGSAVALHGRRLAMSSGSPSPSLGRIARTGDTSRPTASRPTSSRCAARPGMIPQHGAGEVGGPDSGEHPLRPLLANRLACLERRASEPPALLGLRG